MPDWQPDWGYKIDIKSETQAKDAPGFRYEDYIYDDEEYDEEGCVEEGYVEEGYEEEGYEEEYPEENAEAAEEPTE